MIVWQRDIKRDYKGVIRGSGISVKQVKPSELIRINSLVWYVPVAQWYNSWLASIWS